MPAARRGLGRGQRDSDSARADAPAVVEQPSPPTAEIEYAPAGFETDLLRDIVVLTSLCVLQAEGEIAVELGAAEIRQLAQAEPKTSRCRRLLGRWVSDTYRRRPMIIPVVLEV